MAQPSQKILNSLSLYLEALRGHGIRIKSAYLFGSRARGDYRPDSDIDVAVVCSGLSRDFDRQTEQLWGPRRSIDIRIDPVAFREKDFQEENPLAWEILHHGIRIQ